MKGELIKLKKEIKGECDSPFSNFFFLTSQVTQERKYKTRGNKD